MCRAARGSFCRYAFSRACSGDYSWASSSLPIRPDVSSSSATTPRSPSREPSPPFSRRCARSSGVVYAKKPFGGPQAVLAYLSRYTHRVAISNRRLISADETGVSFKWKDYRIEGPDRYKTMTLPTHEFIRRFLTHVLPKGLHRIRHYGLFANGNRAA